MAPLDLDSEVHNSKLYGLYRLRQEET